MSRSKTGNEHLATDYSARIFLSLGASLREMKRDPKELIFKAIIWKCMMHGWMKSADELWNPNIENKFVLCTDINHFAVGSWLKACTDQKRTVFYQFLRKPEPKYESEASWNTWGKHFDSVLNLRIFCLLNPRISCLLIPYAWPYK